MLLLEVISPSPLPVSTCVLCDLAGHFGSLAIMLGQLQSEKKTIGDFGCHTPRCVSLMTREASKRSRVMGSDYYNAHVRHPKISNHVDKSLPLSPW